MKGLEEWLLDKEISFEISGDILEINGFGKMLIIPESDQIIDEEFSFILEDEQYEFLEENEDVKFFAFKWGSMYYYSPLKTKEDQYGEKVYTPSFNVLENIGETPKSDFKFVPLGIHTGYELLNGVGEPEAWVERAKFLGFKTVGICEHNTLAGSLPFQIAAEKRGLKLVIGETITIAVNYDKEKEFQDVYEMKLYVRNATGWRNLLRISKMINVDYDKFIPLEEVLIRGEGLVCVISKDSHFNSLEIEEARDLLEVYKDYFDKVYFQIDLTEYEDERYDIRNLENIKRYFKNFRKDVKPLFLPDFYYVSEYGYKTKDYLNKISKKARQYSKNQNLRNFDNMLEENFHLFENNEEFFNMILDSVNNTKKMSVICNFKIPTGEHKLPRFEVEDSIALYDEQIKKGLRERIYSKIKDPKKIKEYIKRIKIENDVIKGAGFVDYFMILWDVVGWAKRNNIVVGPGRGSVGGSLIAYLLRITDIDPLEYNLLFERFLNKSRVSGERAKSSDSLPDIDLDFESGKRDLVKLYIQEKYGEHHVCSVGTYTRLKPKSSLKDFLRIDGLTFKEVNFATKFIPDSHNPTWGDFFESSSSNKILKNFIQNNCKTVEILKDSLLQPKTESVHPSAVLITPKKDKGGNNMEIYDWIPVKKINGQIVSEWEGEYIGSAGFLKEDILGISQLDKFDSILNFISLKTNKRIDLNNIDFKDKKTFDFFKKGWNEDVFQLGTQGLKTYSRMAKPNEIEDLISMNALYRPGPMESNAHKDFVDMKNGKKESIFDIGMEKVTENTYGLYVYQEQIMQAMVVGGLTLVEADEVRTYMKHFDAKNLAKFEDKFIDGYSKILKIPGAKEYAKEVWNKLYAFSGYGFNRSHSAAYSIISYWCQYLKANYPLEFWTTSLNFANEKEISGRLAEIKKIDEDIKINPPDINKSERNFTLSHEDNSIYWSLTKIKGIGEKTVDEIFKKRESGEFFDLEDFLSRVEKRKCNKTSVRRLIIAGAFDTIGSDNGFRIDEPKERYSIMKKFYKIIKEEIPEEIDKEKCNNNWYWSMLQNELTGYGEISFRSLVRKKSKKLRKFPYIEPEKFETKKFKEVKPWEAEKGDPYTIAGTITELFERKSKNGNWMIKIKLENNNRFIDLSVFGEDWDSISEDFKESFKNKNLICVNGFACERQDWKDKTIFYNELLLTKRTQLITLND